MVDYTEWLAASQYRLKLAPSGVNKAYDATDNEGRKYQIKARRVSSVEENTSFDFAEDSQFDYLIAVFVNRSNLNPILTKKIPSSFVKKHWRRNRRRFSFRWNRKVRALLKEARA